MLSRVAQRFYWIARYLERAENTARLTMVYHNMTLDLSSEIPLDAKALVDITGSYETYQSQYKNVTDRNVYRFILTNPANPGSIFSSIMMARENVRTVRDQMPSDTWEAVNELYLYVKKRFSQQSFHKTLHRDLSEVIGRCQHITGLLAGTMSHGPGYQFIRMGRNLERADMTTRILDVAAMTMSNMDEEAEPLKNRLWMEVLRSLTAYQMYRLNVRFRIKEQRVIEYLLIDTDFPRALMHCIQEMEQCLQSLPQQKEPLRHIKAVKQLLSQRRVQTRANEDLHGYIDDIQLQLASLHEGISTTWFDQ